MAMNQAGAARRTTTCSSSLPWRRSFLRQSAICRRRPADALRPGYAFFLFPQAAAAVVAAGTLAAAAALSHYCGIPQRCIAPVPEILFLFPLTAPRTVMYGCLYAEPGGRNSSGRTALRRLIQAAMLYVGHLKYYKELMSGRFFFSVDGQFVRW